MDNQRQAVSPAGDQLTLAHRTHNCKHTFNNRLTPTAK